MSREKITVAAFELLDQVGLEGMSMRQLANGLGVKSPALYWHFRDKQQLLDQMADTIVRSAGMGPPLVDESWEHWLGRRGRAYREALRRHRDGARIVSTAHTLSPDTVERFDEELAALVDAGFGPALALRTITILSHYVTGYVLQEQAERPDHGAMEALTPQIADGAMATLFTAVREGGGVLGEDVFDHGLDVLITGTKALIDQA